VKLYRVVFRYLAADIVEVEAHSKYEAIEKATERWEESIDQATGQQTYQEESQTNRAPHRTPILL